MGYVVSDTDELREEFNQIEISITSTKLTSCRRIILSRESDTEFPSSTKTNRVGKKHQNLNS